MTGGRALAVLAAALVVLGACGDDPTGPGDPTAFCQEMAESVDQNVTAFDAQDPTDPDAALASLDRLHDLAAPSARDDFATLRDAFARLAEALADIDPTDGEGAARLAAVELDPERIAAAQQAVTDYTRDTCNLNLDATRPVPATSAPTTLPPSTTVFATPTTLAVG